MMMKSAIVSTCILAASLGAPATTLAATEAAESSADIARISSMLTGSWKSTSAQNLFPGSEGESAQIVLNIAPVAVEGLDNALYAEASRADALDKPYRQSIYELYTYKGKTRLRTYEIRNTPSVRPAIVGAWLAPELIGDLSRDDLIATLDVEMAASSGGFSGKTPYPYPTGVGGAVEMTSEISVSNDRLVTQDRGYDASGNVVWGADESAQYTFERFDTGITLKRIEGSEQGDIIAIDYNSPMEGPGFDLDTSARIAAHYRGYLADGSQFDASFDRGAPLEVPAPFRLIEGWRQGLQGLHVGAKRRLVIPYDLAYGEQGNSRIPPRSDLYFDIEIMHVEPGDGAAASEDSHEGHNH